MNLVTDKWIPVVMPDGKSDTVSLNELFSEAGSIRDLSCSPPQRIALMRLLICIVQAALDGPEDEEDWDGCKSRIAKATLEYLGHWQLAFSLYGAKPFMQVSGLDADVDGIKPLDVLDCRLASGNNTTLFDHAAVSAGRLVSDGELVLNLLTFLCFSTGGKVGQSVWQGVKHSESTFAAPCIKYAHTFLRSANLLDTVFLNLMTKNGDGTGILRSPNGKWGQPVWERFPDSVGDVAAFQNASETYLGRLVPLSRFVSVQRAREGRCIAGPPQKGYRIDHLPAFREPWATIVPGKDGKEWYLALSSTKHMWRQLGSLLSLKKSRSGLTGAMSLSNLVRYYSAFPTQDVDVWVGGLEVGAQAGKVNDMLEWAFDVSPPQLGETWMNRYLQGVALADEGATALAKALKSCFNKMNVEAVPYDQARTRYWGRLDASCAVLIDAAKGEQAHIARSWHPIVLRAMREAYDYVCPRQTARQIEAYAQGLARLNMKKPKE
jgi:CRISPR system Cascade subunit CasA